GTARWRTDRTAAGHPQTHVVAPYQLAVRVAAGYRTAQYVCIGGILKKDSMRSGVGNIHVIDGGTLAAGYAEETASGIAGVHTVDGYVRAIVIGYTEGGVAAAAIVVMPDHITHGAVAGIVQQQAAAATVGDGDVADGKAVDAVGLDAVTCGAVDVDVAADGQVARRSGRCINPYPQAYRIIIVQVHGDVVQQDIGAAAKPYAVAGIAGDMQVSDGDVVAPVAIDRHDQFAAVGIDLMSVKIQSLPGTGANSVNVAAVGTAVARVADINSAGAHVIDSGIDRIEVAAALVHGIAIYPCEPAAVGACDFSIGGSQGTPEGAHQKNEGKGQVSLFWFHRILSL